MTRISRATPVAPGPAPAAGVPPAPVAARPLVGIFWMVVCGLCFTGVNIIVKYVGQTVNPAQAVFIRYAFGVVFVIPMIPALLRSLKDGPVMLRFGLRGIVHAGGVLLWFFAMAKIPIAEVTAMGYLQPVFITLIAVLFLGEPIAGRRIAAIACAILGAMIVLRPGFRELSPGHIAMLTVAPMFAISYTMAKSLTQKTSPGVTLAWMSVLVTVFLAPVAAWVWETPGWVEVAGLALTACFATAGHYAMLRAFAVAPITVTQPVTFLQLVWSVTVGALLFAEPVDGFVVLGGVVILGSVLFIAWREARLKRARPAAAAGG